MVDMKSRLIALVIALSALAFSAGQGSTNVTTAGTPVQLTSTATKATGCTITAKSTNSGTIWIGFGSSVSASSKIGTPLGPPVTAGQPGASYACMPPGNTPLFTLNGIWLDATNSGDGVSYSWF